MKKRFNTLISLTVLMMLFLISKMKKNLKKVNINDEQHLLNSGTENELILIFWKYIPQKFHKNNKKFSKNNDTFCNRFFQ